MSVIKRLKQKEVEMEVESIRKQLVGAADTGYSMWHNA